MHQQASSGCLKSVLSYLDSVSLSEVINLATAAHLLLSPVTRHVFSPGFLYGWIYSLLLSFSS